MIIQPSAQDLRAGRLDVEVDLSSKLLFIVSSEAFQGPSRTVNVERILIFAEIQYSDGSIERIRCPSIVGTENELLSLESDDPALLGEVVSMANIGQWRVVVNAE